MEKAGWDPDLEFKYIWVGEEWQCWMGEEVLPLKPGPAVPVKLSLSFLMFNETNNIYCLELLKGDKLYMLSILHIVVI